MSQWLCTCVQNDMDEDVQDIFEDSVTSMRDNLNSANYSSTDFSVYHSGEEYFPTGSDGTEWLTNLGEQLIEDGLAVDGDAWIVVDKVTDFGYGRGNVTVNHEGVRIKVSRVLDILDANPTGDSGSTFRCLSKHELGHSFTLDHTHGDAKYDDNWMGYDVQPMATAYAHTVDGESNWSSSTTFAGRADAPEKFRDADGYHKTWNFVADEWIDSVASDRRHWQELTEASIELIHENAPL